MATMTVKILRESLAHLGAAYDDKPVEIWLPGSRIALNATIMPCRRNAVLIEGNLVPGSALDESATPAEIASFKARREAEVGLTPAIRYIDHAAPNVRARLFEVESVGAMFAHEYATGSVTGFITEKQRAFDEHRVDIVRRWKLNFPSAGAWEVMT